jgi:hypothetical protein
MGQDLILFFILFSGGLLIAVFVGIVWITKVLEQTARTMKQRVSERMSRAMRAMKTRRTIPLQS